MSCYNVKINFIETMARLQSDTKFPTNGFSLSKRMANHVGTKAWQKEVGYSLGDDPGALTLEVEDHGPHGDGCSLHVCSPWSKPPTIDDQDSNHGLLILDLSMEQVALLAEALQTVLRLRTASREVKP